MIAPLVRIILRSIGGIALARGWMSDASMFQDPDLVTVHCYIIAILYGFTSEGWYCWPDAGAGAASMWAAILNWLTGNVRGRVFQTIDASIDNETKREDIKTRGRKLHDGSSGYSAGARGGVPPLFLVSAGLWFASMCIYSVLFCNSFLNG